MSRRRRCDPELEAKARAILAAQDADAELARSEREALASVGQRDVKPGNVLPACAWAPCVPRPWKRPRWDSKRGRTFTSAAAERAGRELAGLLRHSTPTAPFGGPLRLTVTFCMPIPKRRHEGQRDGAPHASRPDIDNLAKLVLDVLSRLRWWHDDAQVSELRAGKFYGERPGVHVRIDRAGWEEP